MIVFLDDAGWSDFRPFGRPKYPTLNVERLARQGCTFRNFYVPQAVCSASRSALLSGCYPCRTKVVGAHGPGAKGLDTRLATMGEVFKAAGYRTACFGKWHIGDQPDTRPSARGFDESSGIMYSNDMWEHTPGGPEAYKVPLRFWRNGEVQIERITKAHQAMFTTWFTEHAVDFIGRNKANPFLLYVPHPMPHVPLFCSEKFLGKSGAGLYGDVILEIDWSIGEISKALQSAGVEDETVFLFTSDNGPWTIYGNHGGATPFREAKTTSFDGGIRSPCIIRYPRGIKAGSVSRRTFCSVDILPTFAHLAGAALPQDPIDGKNLWDLVAGKPGAVNPHEYYAFSIVRTFESVISGDGRWKLHLPHRYRSVEKTGMDGTPGSYRQKSIGLSLFDMEKDPYETTNVIEKHPEVAARLQSYAERHKRGFYD